jgi:hypothetical protein
MQSTAGKWRRAGYILSFLMVAGVAARVSYSHIRDVALYGHQPADAATLLPLAVDGMMLIATLAMAEDKAANRNPRGWARFGFWFGAVISTVANVSATVVKFGWEPLAIGIAALAPLLLLLAIEIVARPGKPKPRVLAEQPRVIPGNPVRVTPEPVVEAQRVVAAEVTRLPVPVSPAPQRRATPDPDRTPIFSERQVVSPLTGKVLIERPPRK